MLTRLLALAVVGGLGVGLVLRIWFGRQRFRALVALGALPIAVHVAVTLVAALRAEVDLPVVGIYLLIAAAVAVVGVLVGRRNVDTRPWLSAFTPLLSAAAYGVTALLLIGLTLRASGHALNVLGVAGIVTGSIFATCALVSFAPRATTPAARGQQRSRTQ